MRALFGRNTMTPLREIRLDLDPGTLSCIIKVRRSAKARRLTLRLASATGALQVTAPPHVPSAAIEAFIDRHRGWIEKSLARLPQRVRFVGGAILPLRGVDHVLNESGALRGLVVIENMAEGLPRLIVPGTPAHVERRLVDYLKAEARSDLVKVVETYAALIAVRPRRIVIRDGSSRWGSCAANGALSFSWRLVLAPPFVLDYVAAHEVAHLVHMNHSPLFWQLLGRICPQGEAAKAWIAANGRRLHSYGPPPGPRRGDASPV